MNYPTHKKAFTLTELLVVVIVIGILAAVSLPKFNKVLETRKTTEAEELMAAVRTEQEKRCAFDKNYLTDFKDVSDIMSSKASKNFNYSFTPTGMKAVSAAANYTLQMPSYRDGRICCQNDAECVKLNKNYPLCAQLTAKADYQPGTECAGLMSCSGLASQSCGCLGRGMQSRTCDTSTGEWNAWGSCSIAQECSCSGVSSQRCGCNNTGTQTRTCNTTTGEWNGWGGCSTAACKDCPVSSKPALTQSCGNCGSQSHSVTCDVMTGTWQTGGWSSCSGQGECAVSDTQTQGCPSGFIGTQTRTCDGSCRWGGWTGACAPACQNSYDSSTVTANPNNLTDTCDGNVNASFYCSNSTKGKSCTDYSRITCTPRKEVANWWTSDTADGYTPGIMTCGMSVRNKVLGTSSLPSARDMCGYQCTSGGTSSAFCEVTCEVLGNCWSAGYGGGQKCQLRRLICQYEGEASCTYQKRNVQCCP